MATTVLITGASSGIGRATAEAFLRRGARVVGLARSKDKLDAMAEQWGGADRFLPVSSDVADGAAMERAAAAVLQLAGVPDVIVANAGIGLDALFTHTSDAALRAVLEVNVLGVVRSIRPFLPHMVQRGSGRIVIVSSIVGKRGIPYYSAYSASKFALHGMADALRAELYASGVSVGIVCPSSTASEFQRHLLREGPGQRRVRPRSHSVESVARAVVRMADSRRRQRILSLEAKLLTFFSIVTPGLIDRLLARMLRSGDGKESARQTD